MIADAEEGGCERVVERVFGTARLLAGVKCELGKGQDARRRHPGLVVLEAELQDAQGELIGGVDQSHP